MIYIALVEDEEAYAKQLKKYIKRYAAESGEQFEVTWFSDGDAIVEHYRPQFDIILLDIQMKFMNGMETAKAIRKVDQEVVIIFITNMAQYAIQGYEVDALDYILKPIPYFAFSQRLDRAIVRMKKRTRQYMTISIRNSTQKIDIRDIYYVESQAHKLVFHTKMDDYTTSGTLKEIEGKLLDKGFFRCNKGYIVNLEYVDAVQEGCAIVNNEKLLISRSRKKDFMKSLVEYMGDVVK